MIRALNLSNADAKLAIRTRDVKKCPVCGSGGNLLYEDLRDRQYDASGVWCTRVCSKDVCGLLWLDPMPIEEDLYKAYSRYHTHSSNFSRVPSAVRDFARWVDRGYLARRCGYNAESMPAFQKFMSLILVFHPLRRRMLHEDVRYLDADSCAKVLDVGCGSGEWAIFMKSLGVDVEALDFDPLAVEAALEKGISAHVGSLEDSAYPDNTFDLINLSHVIEHVPDPEETLRECERILKPHGIVAILTPNSESLGHRIFKENWRGIETPRHLHIMNARNMKDIVTMAGLDEIKTYFNGFGCTIRESCAMARESSRKRTTWASKLVEFCFVRAISALEMVNMAIAPSRGQFLFTLAQKNAITEQSERIDCATRN